MLRNQIGIVSSTLIASLFLACIPTISRADDFQGRTIFPAVGRTEIPEIEQLRIKLRAAYSEIEQLRNIDRVQQTYFQQDGNQANSPSNQGTASGSDLAKQSQNPISSLVSLPYQSNFDYGIGPNGRTNYTGNLQPVVPVKLNEEWNLINRIIVPFINSPIGAQQRTQGIGDITGQFFFSPGDPGRIIWGIGPSVVFPAASNNLLGTQEWGAGINAVALISEGPILAGALVNQIWSTEGTTKPFLIQPFFNYNLPEGWYISASGEIIADWERTSETRWIVPLGGGFGRVFPIFGQPVNMSMRFAPYVKKPAGGPDWQFRFQVTMLFPK